MQVITNRISPIELNKEFRIKDGAVERHYKTIGWRVVRSVTNPDGYWKIRWNNKMYLYHRFVWVLHYNKDILPGLEIDHIDGNRVNNNIDNLRTVTHRENALNKKTHRDGHLCGCYFHKKDKRWRVRMRVDGKRKSLGGFKTEQEAHDRYKQALKQITNKVVREGK